MNTVKVLLPTSFHLQTPSVLRRHNLFIRRRSAICFCNSDESDSDPSSSPSPSQGDKQKQELLVQIAMLQAQKVRLTDFLDERAAYLTQYAEDANTEFDQIGENALKDLEDATARIMGNLEIQSQAFEESAEMNKEEIEKNEKILEEFEEQIARDRNEGLFFKNLSEKTPKNPVKLEEAKLEAQRIEETTKKSAGSKLRRRGYLALISLLVVSIGNAVFAANSEVEWRKVAALGLVLVGLIAQYTYEKNLSSLTEELDDKKEQEPKNHK